MPMRKLSDAPASKTKNENNARQGIDKDKVIQSLAWTLGVIFVTGLGVLGWIAQQVWAMNPVVKSTADRVDRIVAVLPDLRVRLAKEEVEESILKAIIITEASRCTTGNWCKAVSLVDTPRSIVYRWDINLVGPEDRSVDYAVVGLAHSSRDEVRPLRALVNSSLELDRKVSAPRYVDIDRSFTFTSTNFDYHGELIKLLGSTPKETPFTAKLNGWVDLSRELKENSSVYK